MAAGGSSSRCSWGMTGLVGMQLFYAGGPPLLGEHVLLGCSASSCLDEMCRGIAYGSETRDRTYVVTWTTPLMLRWNLSGTVLCWCVSR